MVRHTPLRIAGQEITSVFLALNNDQCMNNTDSSEFAELALSEVPFADLTESAFARDPDFGGPERNDEIDFRRLKVSLGNRPVSWRLRSFFKKAGKVLPKGMKLYRDWDVWMIAHAVSVTDRGEFATLLNGVVDAVGYEAEFDRAMATTVGLLPEPAVVRNVGGNFEVTANIGLNGSIATTEGMQETIADLDLPVAGGAKLGFSTSTEFVGRLTFGIWTPKVIATGICSSKCEWLFNRIEAPLRNSQVMFQTILIQAGTDELKFKCRAYALIRSVGFIPVPTRFETKWHDVWTRPIAEF